MKRDRVRLLMGAGAAAGPLFAATFLVEGARRSGYDSLRHSVSDLALGPGGWVQTVNFTATGGLVICGAVGLRAADRDRVSRNLVPPLVAAAGLGLLASAMFPTDPVSGYPPGTPPVPERPSNTGAAHGIAAIPIFLGIPAAAGVDAVRAIYSGHPVRAAFSAMSGAGMIAAMAVAGAGFGQHPKFVGHAGLLQRLSIACGFGWLTALYIRISRRKRSDRM